MRFYKLSTPFYFMSIKKILDGVLENVRPSDEEVTGLEKTAKEFIKQLSKKGFKAYIGGSLAKGTLVRKDGAQDVDIFVVFDYSEDIKKLEGILKKIKLPGKLKKVHGSRDYFQIDTGTAILEIVPVAKNDDPELAENVTDVSLRHVKYVGGAIRASQVPSSRAKNLNLADEIRLAKAFCRAQRFYGAESYVKGFSGYSLEVLVIHFGSFVKFLKGVGKKLVIDPLKYFRGERDVMNELNSSKLQGPLVLVDPTYKYRNVTAGLGLETFNRFLEAAKSFLKSPSADYFKRAEIDIAELKSFAGKKKAKFVEVSLKTDRQEGDIAGTKMRKVFDFFARELGRKQQVVLREEFDYSGSGKSAKGYLVVMEKKEIEGRGPSIHMDDAVGPFKKARGAKNVFQKKGYWWYRERASIKSVLDSVKKVEKEMGASLKIA